MVVDLLIVELTGDEKQLSEKREHIGSAFEDEVVNESGLLNLNTPENAVNGSIDCLVLLEEAVPDRCSL